ncbi:hypothetical protein ACKKBF_B32790 [Auxenochlorella protothecoides x Auxenochlorella symbiontica]
MAFRGVHTSSLPAVYSDSMGATYSKTFKPSRDSSSGVSWRVLTLLLLGVGATVYTLRSSSSSEAARVARQAAYDKLYPGSTRYGARGSMEEPSTAHAPVRKWSQRGVRRVLESEGAVQAEAAAATVRPPASGFDPERHQQYLDLPPLPAFPPSEYMGGWALTQDVYDRAARHPAATVLSFDSPRLVLFKSFLSPGEVDHLVDISKDHMARSEVLHADGDGSVSDIRTSYGHWPTPTPTTHNITDRIHRLVGIPEKFGEDLYVLRYLLGQQYEAHNDHCMDNLSRSRKADPACRDFLKRARGPECGPGHGGETCGDRMATFILVLKHPSKGGHTVFPEATITQASVKNHGHAADDSWYCKDSGVLGAAPEAGDALLFWDYRPGGGSGQGSYEDGTADPSATPVYEALHSGCPVLEGEKWIVTRWIRGAGFDYVPPNTA